MTSPKDFPFSFKTAKLLFALCATSALYIGFPHLAMAQQSVRQTDEVEPTIEINLDALDTLKGTTYPTNEHSIVNATRHKETKTRAHAKKQHTKKTTAHAPKHTSKPAPVAKLEAPKEEIIKEVAPKAPSKKELAAAKAAEAKATKAAKRAEEKATKEAKAAEIKAAKAAKEAKAAEEKAAASKPAPAPIKAPEPEKLPEMPVAPSAATEPPPPLLPPANEAEIKKATAPIPELNPTAPPAPPPVAVDTQTPLIPAAPAPAAAVDITPMPPAPSPMGEFAAALNEQPQKAAAKAAAEPTEVALPSTAAITPPEPPKENIAKPDEKTASLPSISMLLGNKQEAPTAAAPTNEAPAEQAQLPSPQALMDKLEPPAPKAPPKEAPKTADNTKTEVNSGKPTLRVVFLSTETSVPLSVHPELDKIVKRLKASSERATLTAYASGAGDQATTARRVSLSRALAVRAYLIDQGISNLRINVQAEGNKSTGGEPDRVDIFVSDK